MEIIGECPRENSDAVAERLSQVMIESAATVCRVPMKCDCYEVARWYEDDFSNAVYDKYKKLMEEESMSYEDALTSAQKTYPQISFKYLKEMIDGKYVCNVHSDI